MKLSFSSARSSLRLLASTAIALAALTVSASAASPDKGTLSPTSTTAVEWNGTAPASGSGGGETTCVDGVNCDVFTITLSGDPADYAGKQLVLSFSWSLPADDYDFYIHKDKIDGPEVATGANGGAPATTDGAAINPATSGTGVYVVHIVYFTTVPADQYHGKAEIKSAAQSGPGGNTRTATYVSGGIGFSNNVALKAPATLRDGEPSNRTDIKGNAYVGGIRGFPAGVDLWFFDLNPNSPTYDPNMRVPFYRGQPDAFSPSPTLGDLGGDGGGDIDLAVSFGIPNGQTDPTLAFSSLIAANVSTGNSTDRAATYNKNPLGNVTGGVAADDRQWEEFLGTSSVYLFYRTLEPAVTQIQRSDDGGFTFGPAISAGTTSQVGPIDVHQATGTVYGGTSQGTVVVGTTSNAALPPTSYTVNQAATDPNGVAHLFFVTKVADDGTPNGTVYVCYSNDVDIFLKHSTDQGKTWSDPVKVNDGTTKVNVFPWMETGPTPGSVGVVWYGTTNPKNDDAAEWQVFYAQSFDATATSPTFRNALVTEPEHFIHASNISEGGLTGAANRNLIDYFQVSFDPNGAAVIAYTDDHNDYDGHTYAARQISGPSIKTGAALPAPTEGAGLARPPGSTLVDANDVFPPRQPGYNGEQVVDFLQDVQNGQVVRERVNDPSDVLTVRYDTSGTGASLAIAATMKVSDLTVIPGQTTWQMNFAVNAPHAVLSRDGTYSFAASDHSDQFYVQADTDPSGAQTFTYGTAARASDGKMIYTPVGAADAGEFNQTDNTISVQVSVAKLNAALPAGHTPIGDGTVVAGLRARSYTIEVVPPVNGQASRQGRRDIARGGTQFVVHDSAFPLPAPTPVSSPYPKPATSPSPGTTAPNVELANISTRLQVKSGDEVGIAGFIIRSSESKRVIVRGIGPSLRSNGEALPGALQDPVLEVYDEAGTLIATNDDWRSTQQAEVTASGLAPTDDHEPAVILNLAGGSYTAIVKGKSGAQGVGVVEVYDLNAESIADLGNISTRGPVGTGEDVLIAGVIVRDKDDLNTPQNIIVRGIGPSLTGVQNALADPVLTLHDPQGNQIASNNDWQDADAGPISATTLAPSDPKEAAILTTLTPGAYTAVLTGNNGGTGIGSVEAYALRVIP